MVGNPISRSRSNTFSHPGEYTIKLAPTKNDGKPVIGHQRSRSDNSSRRSVGFQNLESKVTQKTVTLKPMYKPDIHFEVADSGIYNSQGNIRGPSRMPGDRTTENFDDLGLDFLDTEILETVTLDLGPHDIEVEHNLEALKTDDPPGLMLESKPTVKELKIATTTVTNSPPQRETEAKTLDETVTQNKKGGLPSTKGGLKAFITKHMPKLAQKLYGSTEEMKTEPSPSGEKPKVSELNTKATFDVRAFAKSVPKSDLNGELTKPQMQVFSKQVERLFESVVATAERDKRPFNEVAAEKLQEFLVVQPDLTIAKANLELMMKAVGELKDGTGQQPTEGLKGNDAPPRSGESLQLLNQFHSEVAKTIGQTSVENFTKLALEIFQREVPTQATKNFFRNRELAPQAIQLLFRSESPRLMEQLEKGIKGLIEIHATDPAFISAQDELAALRKDLGVDEVQKRVSDLSQQLKNPKLGPTERKSLEGKLTGAEMLLGKVKSEFKAAKDRLASELGLRYAERFAKSLFSQDENGKFGLTDLLGPNMRQLLKQQDEFLGMQKKPLDEIEAMRTNWNSNNFLLRGLASITTPIRANIPKSGDYGFGLSELLGSAQNVLTNAAGGIKQGSKKEVDPFKSDPHYLDMIEDMHSAFNQAITFEDPQTGQGGVEGGLPQQGGVPIYLNFDNADRLTEIDPMDR